MLKYLPADLIKYVLNSFTSKSPPFHATFDDVSTPPERLEIEQITGRQLVRGRGGVIAVLCETHWVGLFSPSWERELGLPHSRRHILIYWSGTSTQHRQTNCLYRQMRIGSAQPELSRSRGQIVLASGYTLLPCDLWLRSLSSSVLPPRAHFWLKACDGLWWLRKIADRIPSDSPSDITYIIRFLDDPGPVKINLRPAKYTTSSVAICGPWCFKTA